MIGLLAKEDKLKIEGISELTSSLLSSLLMLYQPLIGKEATFLYQILLSIHARKANVPHHALIEILGNMSIDQIEKNRGLLEQFLLIKTYYQDSSKKYIYQLFPPLEGNAFLRHEVFGRLYMREMGKQMYEVSKLCFADDYTPKDDYKNISIPFQNVFKSAWEDQQEQSFEMMKPQEVHIQENTIPITFHYDRFLSGLSSLVFPSHERNEKNLRLIGELATIYGISEEKMRKLVGKSMNLKTNMLDHEVLKKMVRSSKTNYEEKESNVYALPPVRFLQKKQHGIEVTSSDKRLIEILIRDYQMKPDVVNVLLEYVLANTNQRLTRSYVEKIAGTWIRLQLDSHEKALQFIANEKNKQYTQSSKKIIELPDWFHEADKESTDDESQDRKNFDKEAFLEKMRKLRGD